MHLFRLLHLLKAETRSRNQKQKQNNLSRPYVVEKRCGFSRRAHDPKVVGSNPTSAKTFIIESKKEYYRENSISLLFFLIFSKFLRFLENDPLNIFLIALQNLNKY